MSKGQGTMVNDRPVASFPIKFQWQTGDLYDLFEQQVKMLKNEIADARAADCAVMYLSCPISSRGGGYDGTNADIARHTERRVMDRFGHRFWILNPARYQMETKEGRGRIRQHAETLGYSPQRLAAVPRAKGGDYMRMWTRVLVEDSFDDGLHLGRDFDAFYFIGPEDVRHFFTRGGAVTLTAGIEEYFARKVATDPDFRDNYTVPDIRWDPNWQRPAHTPVEVTNPQRTLRDDWEMKRKWFVRFYSLRASANFSLGCHDEWNIFCLINRARLQHNSEILKQIGDVGDLLAGFFDGRQVDPGAAVSFVDRGYATATGEQGSINPVASNTVSDDEAAINQRRETAAAAYNRGDIETLLDCWDATDCVYMLPNEPALVGIDAIRSSYASFFDKFTADIEYPGEKLEVIGDWAFGRFSSKTTITPKDGGKPIDDVWKGIHIYRRQPDGSWKYRVVIGNSDLPRGET